MNVKKEEKVYTVVESERKWLVKRTDSKVTVSFDISKDLCETAEELKAYILKNEMF